MIKQLWHIKLQLFSHETDNPNFIESTYVNPCPRPRGGQSLAGAESVIVLDNCGGCGNAAYLPDEIQKGRFHGSQDSLKITSLIVEYLSILVLQTLKCFDFNSGWFWGYEAASVRLWRRKR